MALDYERGRIARARAAIQAKLDADEMQYDAEEFEKDMRVTEFEAQLTANRQPNESDLKDMPPGWFSGRQSQCQNHPVVHCAVPR